MLTPENISKFPAPWPLYLKKALKIAFVLASVLFVSIAGTLFYLQQRIVTDYRSNYQTSAEKASQLLSEELHSLLVIAGMDGLYSTRTLQKIREAVFKVEAGNAAYLFIVDKQGVFLHHPNRDLSIAAVNAQTFFPEKTKPILENAFQKRERQFIRYADHGQVFWLFIEPLAETSFFMGLVCSESELALLPDVQRFYLILFLLGCFVLIFAGALYQGLWELNYKDFKWLSAWISLALIANICFAWYLQINFNVSPHQSQSLQSPTDLTRYRALIQVTSSSQSLGDPVFVPTGLQIRSLSFERPDLVRVSGDYWQRFSYGKASRIAETERGIIFPQAREVRFRNHYLRRLPQEELSGGSFEVVLQQPLNHTRYPLNREQVRVRFSAPESAQNLVLIPDLDAYPFPYRVGLDPSLSMDGWNIYHTDFSYVLPESISQQAGPGFFKQNPELNFNFYVQRSFWGVVILNLIYVGMVLLLLFWILSRTTHSYQAFYRPLDIFGPAIGLLFPLLFAHSNLHLGVTGVERLFYLDYFYFIVYLMIIVVVAHFLFQHKEPDSPWNLNDSILLRSTYWPVVFGFLEIVTLAVFW
jgi:hypothetical protein